MKISIEAIIKFKKTFKNIFRKMSCGELTVCYWFDFYCDVTFVFCLNLLYCIIFISEYSFVFFLYSKACWLPWGDPQVHAGTAPVHVGTHNPSFVTFWSGYNIYYSIVMYYVVLFMYGWWLEDLKSAQLKNVYKRKCFKQPVLYLNLLHVRSSKLVIQ